MATPSSIQLADPIFAAAQYMKLRVDAVGEPSWWGVPVTEVDWTPELRAKFKPWVHGVLYGTTG